MNKIENYLDIANHDIQMANNSQELKSYVASILCENDELQQENQKYKEVIDKAIKYLDSFSFKNKPYYIPLNKYQDYQELLEILRGGINGKNRSTKR